MPDKRTVLRWLAAHESFREQYAIARELQVDHFADEILEIADDGTNDWIKRSEGDDGSEAASQLADHEHISRSKLRVEARKWLMAKMAPRKYGDRLALEHAGPMKTVKEMTDAELEYFILAEAAAERERRGDGDRMGAPAVDPKQLQ